MMRTGTALAAAGGAVAALSLFSGLVHAIPTIQARGSKFFTSEGDQWYMKGIAYQLVPDDPLINATQCDIDSSLMEELGANAIRVYHVDPDADHDDCMQTFAEKGIWMFIDLDTFDTQIEQIDPHWNETQYDAFAKVMDTFHIYDNVAGFFVGNEVITTGNGSSAAPYVKAAARDMKAYRDDQDYRKIPIGYSAADIATLRPMLQNYFACGDDESESLDFFGLNAYEWCGDSTYRVSGYADLTANASDYNIPIFLSETGCNQVQPRDFADQEAIFSEPEMLDVWSGCIVYEWIQEANDYGLVQYGDPVDPSDPDAPPDGYFRSGTPTPVQPDFNNLKSRWETLSPTGVQADEYTPSLDPPPCPAFTEGSWEVDPDGVLPQVGEELPAAGATTGSAASGSEGASETSGGASPSSTGAAPGGLGVGRPEGVGMALMGVLGAMVVWL
ncbi:Glucanosyltransferase-domain-containing protein [Lineolata rhizophorae]|uniref:1,3-beta-glucanosyltransferase n=1 Tax=Lineolata rhizophorae TaxID=578093 RepID=A0A6A6P4L7_9PEZI|nr:Glucanosyltransferase-domain-containing protein [Lineolata rhizophorae]